MARTPTRYSEEFKRRAVERMTAASHNIPGLARELGVSRSLLYAWRKQYTAPLVSPRPEGEGQGVRAVGADQSDAQTLTAQNERLRQTLLDTAFALAGAIRATTESAPLNQLSAALGLVIDRLLKLEALAPGSTIAPSEEVIRIEYLDQDGGVDNTSESSGGFEDFGTATTPDTRLSVANDFTVIYNQSP